MLATIQPQPTMIDLAVLARLVAEKAAKFPELAPQIERAGRLVADGRVTEPRPHCWVVGSATCARKVYGVYRDGAQWRCFCPHWQHRLQGTRKPCQHIIATALFQQATRRPLVQRIPADRLERVADLASMHDGYWRHLLRPIPYAVVEPLASDTPAGAA